MVEELNAKKQKKGEDKRRQSTDQDTVQAGMVYVQQQEAIWVGLEEKVKETVWKQQEALKEAGLGEGGRATISR